MESSVAHFHGSRGQVRRPAGPNLRSEPAIIARLRPAGLLVDLDPAKARQQIGDLAVHHVAAVQLGGDVDAGAPVVCAVSAPTALAVRIAEEARITLVAVTRADGFEVFTHPSRVALD